jgi:hypothetical protein
MTTIRARVRRLIAAARLAFPDFPHRQPLPGETAEVAEIEELGELIKQMVAILPAAERDAIRLQAARDASMIRSRWEAELRAGSRTAGRMLLGAFATKGDGEH